MGYNSIFDLHVYTDDADEKLERAIGIKFKMESKAHWINNGDYSSWSSYRVELEEFSKKYKNILFGLCRQGEDFGDLERLFFKEGISISEKPEIKWNTLCTVRQLLKEEFKKNILSAIESL